MGQRRRRDDDKPIAKVMAEVKAMRRWMGERVFWGVSAVLAVAVIALVAMLASGSGSSSSSSSSTTSTSSTSSPESRYLDTLRGRIGDDAFVSNNEQTFLEAGREVCQQAAQTPSTPLLGVAYYASFNRPVLIQRWKNYYDETRFTDAIAVVQSARDELCP